MRKPRTGSLPASRTGRELAGKPKAIDDQTRVVGTLKYAGGRQPPLASDCKRGLARG